MTNDPLMTKERRRSNFELSSDGPGTTVGDPHPPRNLAACRSGVVGRVFWICSLEGCHNTAQGNALGGRFSISFCTLKGCERLAAAL
jgi:hypothetical protein